MSKSTRDGSVVISKFVFDSAATAPTFVVSFETHGYRDHQLRVAVFVGEEDGKPAGNNGAEEYQTPEGNLTVQRTVVPEYDNTVFENLELAIPFNQFYEGRHTYTAVVHILDDGVAGAAAGLEAPFWVDRSEPDTVPVPHTALVGTWASDHGTITDVVWDAAEGHYEGYIKLPNDLGRDIGFRVGDLFTIITPTADTRLLDERYLWRTGSGGVISSEEWLVGQVNMASWPSPDEGYFGNNIRRVRVQ
jgi:hypothetical protein